MDKDKILKGALELIEHSEQNRIFKSVSDKELQNAFTGGLLCITQNPTDTSAICITLELAREIARRFQPPQQAVEVPVEHI